MKHPEGPTVLPQPANDHNVYIVGAGFSAERGIPVVAGFLDRMRDAYDSVKEPSAKDAIARVMDFRRSASSASNRMRVDAENIEHLFSLASLAGYPALLSAIPHAIAATIEFASRGHAKPTLRSSVAGDELKLWPKSWPRCDEDARRSGGVVVDLYETLLATMLGDFGRQSGACRNTFISFNYDLVVEEAAWALGKRVSYGFARDRWSNASGSDVHFGECRDAEVTLLKLHGSINWTRGEGTEDPIAVHAASPLGHLEGDRLVLIPPTWNKSLIAPIDQVWDAAVNAIAEATRIIVLGYSVPATDTHFRYLMAAGLLDNISLRSVAFVGKSDTDPRYKDANESFRARVDDLIQPGEWMRRRLTVEMDGATKFLLTKLPYDWGRSRVPGYAHAS
ncbi:MAG: SIR2 family protein [Planctomycetes bacterium]|jgi:hypothetical protein|nr:SIR2 family protein [Planctomycetota bacterium]